MVLAGKAQGQERDSLDGQTINFTDKSNLRQGLWVYYYDTLHTMISCKGNFVNGRREGVWTNYFKSGKVKSTITFTDNREEGFVKFFYENGQVSEEGYWVNNHWVGEYRYYYSNGQLAYQWYHDETGRRTGQQNYYYENGKVRITGNWAAGMENGKVTEYYENGRLRSESKWKNGATHGIMKEYYEDGSLRAERVFNNGIYDPISSRVYRERNKHQDKDTSAPVIVKPPEDNPPLVDNGNESKPQNPAMFTGSGYFKLLNDRRQVDREGDFVNGILVTGKRYYYNSMGRLIRVAIYENGRIVNTIDY